MSGHVHKYGGEQMYLIASRDVTLGDFAILCDEVERVFGVICEPLARCEGGLHITDWPGKVDGQDREVRLPQLEISNRSCLGGTIVSPQPPREDKELVRGSAEACYEKGRIDILFKHFGVSIYSRADMEKWAACFERIGAELKCWKSYWEANQQVWPSGY